MPTHVESAGGYRSEEERQAAEQLNQPQFSGDGGMHGILLQLDKMKEKGQLLPGSKPGRSYSARELGERIKAVMDEALDNEQLPSDQQVPLEELPSLRTITRTGNLQGAILEVLQRRASDPNFKENDGLMLTLNSVLGTAQLAKHLKGEKIEDLYK